MDMSPIREIVLMLMKVLLLSIRSNECINFEQSSVQHEISTDKAYLDHAILNQNVLGFGESVEYVHNIEQLNIKDHAFVDREQLVFNLPREIGAKSHKIQTPHWKRALKTRTSYSIRNNTSANCGYNIIDEKLLITFKDGGLLYKATNCTAKLGAGKTGHWKKIISKQSAIQKRNLDKNRSDSSADKEDSVRTKRSSAGEEDYVIEFNSLEDVYTFLHSILSPNLTMSSLDSNGSSDAERLCLTTLNVYYSQHEYDGKLYCNSSWDTYSCWPRTLAGTTATIPCPAYLKGINKTNNATKYCRRDGTWAEKAVYDMCVIVDDEETNDDMSHLVAIRVIYNVGFTVSTLALLIALFIFLYFRSLRCLRNSIHCHLIVTFILKNIVWIIMSHTLIYMQKPEYAWSCRMLTSIYNYFHATNFYWMFVEGLYLHIIIVWTYSADKIKLRYLIIIGWVLPSATIIAWIVVRALYENDQCWLPPEGIINYDFIYIAPILFVLCANIIFLSTIVWVLITKLRASHSLETRQYRKAVKATIILFPLLGIAYVIFITSPSEDPKVKIVYKYINAVLQSFQGLLVAIFYCFLNGEVKSVLKKKLKRYNDARSLSTKFTRTSYGWTRGSRDYGNTVTLTNGGLVDTNYRTSPLVRDCVTESIPLTDSADSYRQKQQCHET